MAKLVTSVTGVMLGMAFEAVGGPPATNVFGRVLCLATTGTENLTVALSCEDPTGVQLSCAMFGCAPIQVDGQMIEDTMSELLNMTAGLVKGIVAPKQLLGLPRSVNPVAFQATAAAGDWCVFILRSGGLELSLCVTQETQVLEALSLCG